MSFVRLGKAAAAGKRYCPHHFGSGVSLHSSLHVLAAAGGTGLLEYDCHPDAGPRDRCRGPATRGGRLRSRPAGPGLGAIPDVAALNRYRTWPSRH